MRHSNQLIGAAKAIIKNDLKRMAAQIPPGYNQWNHGDAVIYKDICSATILCCSSPRSTLDQLVHVHFLMEGFWK